jgi:acyl-coenzyme A thioesterase PaaI-like protein
MNPVFLQTHRKEGFKRRLYRYFMNIYPAIFGTGVKILFISDDWHEVHLRLSVNFWTRNYVGTIFGGSLFSATDSFYMIMLYNILGKEFVVWDKAAHIKFKRPGKEKVYAKFHLSTEDIEHISQTAREKGEYVFELKVNWLNSEGKTITEIDRFLYVATKDFYKKKMEAKGIAV